MRVLFDQGVPAPLRKSLKADVSTCFEMGWAELSNGNLLAEAENQFDALITTDKNLKYQQDIATRTIAIFVLPTTRWPSLRLHTDALASAIEKLTTGDFVQWDLPES